MKKGCYKCGGRIHEEGGTASNLEGMSEEQQMLMMIASALQENISKNGQEEGVMMTLQMLAEKGLIDTSTDEGVKQGISLLEAAVGHVQQAHGNRDVSPEGLPEYNSGGYDEMKYGGLPKAQVGKNYVEPSESTAVAPGSMLVDPINFQLITPWQIENEDRNDPYHYYRKRHLWTLPQMEIEQKKGEEAKQFITDWSNSPMYEKMLRESAGKDYDFMANQRALNLATAPDYEVHEHPHEEWNAVSWSDTGKIDFHTGAFDRPGVWEHEWSHTQDRPVSWEESMDRIIPQKDIDMIKEFSSYVDPDSGDEYTYNWKGNKVKAERAEYLTRPTETRARLNAIRSIAQQAGIYDPFTEEINEEAFNKLLENANHRISHPDLEFKIPSNTALTDLREVYTDEQIIQMLNSIAMDDSEQYNDFGDEQFAKYGGRKLRKAQWGRQNNRFLNNVLKPRKLDFNLTPRLDFTSPFVKPLGAVGPSFTGMDYTANPFDMSNYDWKEQATKRLLEDAKKKAETQTTVDETVDDQEKAYHTTTTKNLDAAPVLKGDMRRLRTLQNFGIGDPKRSLMYADQTGIGDYAKILTGFAKAVQLPYWVGRKLTSPNMRQDYDASGLPIGDPYRVSNKDLRKERRDQRMMYRGPSKTDLIDQQLMKHDWTKDHWDDLSIGDKNYARRTYAFENPEYRRLSDKVVFGAQGTKFYEKSKKQKEEGGQYDYRSLESIENNPKYKFKIHAPMYQGGGTSEDCDYTWLTFTKDYPEYSGKEQDAEVQKIYESWKTMQQVNCNKNSDITDTAGSGIASGIATGIADIASGFENIAARKQQKTFDQMSRVAGNTMSGTAANPQNPFIGLTPGAQANQTIGSGMIDPYSGLYTGATDLGITGFGKRGGQYKVGGEYEISEEEWEKLKAMGYGGTII